MCKQLQSQDLSGPYPPPVPSHPPFNSRFYPLQNEGFPEIHSPLFSGISLLCPCSIFFPQLSSELLSKFVINYSIIPCFIPSSRPIYLFFELHNPALYASFFVLHHPPNILFIRVPSSLPYRSSPLSRYLFLSLSRMLSSLFDPFPFLRRSPMIESSKPS